MKFTDYRECGFRRITAIVPRVHLADIEANTTEICRLIRSNAGSDVLLFPELCVTGYSIGDLFNQDLIIRGAMEAIEKIAVSTRDIDSMIVVGSPVRCNSQLFNCAVFLHKGQIKAFVPKCHIPDYSEYYESRWFASAFHLHTSSITVSGRDIPFSNNIIIRFRGMGIAAEICEDLWVPNPPSGMLSMAGANVILNLSASNYTIGKQSYRTNLIRQQSARCRCVYAYASAGEGESSTDLAFPGYAAIAANGDVEVESGTFPELPAIVSADIDIERIDNDRLRHNTFNRMSSTPEMTYIDINEDTPMGQSDKTPSEDIMIALSGKGVDPHPFVDSDKSRREERCAEIVDIQCHALKQRLSSIHCDKIVVGVSGGLDSTLALLVACRAFDKLKLSRKGIFGITMPGLATTSKTRNNAWQLMELLGITPVEIPIGEAVSQHFSDIGQDPRNFDATYENSQARERTQILMDYANKTGGIVLGTGDLSELALGWCTYNGDHISMYGINASVPKTLVRHLVEWFADRSENAATAQVLRDIIDTPISPELVPSADGDDIAQKTEDLVGPYELHDFFLYNMLRHSFRPSKIFILANEAFKGKYDAQTVLKWLRTFYRRFFSQQFKRSCMPDGPKVGSVCLSPRGDWRMPSDALANLWISELDKLADCSGI